MQLPYLDFIRSSRVCNFLLLLNIEIPLSVKGLVFDQLLVIFLLYDFHYVEVWKYSMLLAVSIVVPTTIH